MDASQCYVETARLLLEHGATLEPTRRGETALMCAVCGNNPAMVTLLLDHGADLFQVR